MRRHPSAIALALLLAVLGLAGCGGNRELAYRDVEIGEREAQIADLKGQLAARDSELAALRNRAPVVVSKAPKGDHGLGKYGAEVTWRNGEMVIAIENSILFRSGSAELSTQAKTTLGKVIEVIKGQYPGHYVRIEGHTDNQPIVRTKDKWEDNWHLSGARARAVLHRLVERGGLSEKLVSFAGYSAMRPREGNDSASGRSRNRRVEIVVLPKTPGGDEAVPAAAEDDDSGK